MTAIDPVILFFLFGLAAGLLRSQLKLPSALYDSLSVFLLLAIGLKGGQGLATLEADGPPDSPDRRGDPARRGADPDRRPSCCSRSRTSWRPSAPSWRC